MLRERGYTGSVQRCCGNLVDRQITTEFVRHLQLATKSTAGDRGASVVHRAGARSVAAWHPSMRIAVVAWLMVVVELIALAGASPAPTCARSRSAATDGARHA